MRSLDVIFLVRNEVQLRKERLLYSFSILLKNLCCSLVVWGEVSNDINKIIYHSALKVNNSQYTLIC
jgi:hypothetical protein